MIRLAQPLHATRNVILPVDLLGHRLIAKWVRDAHEARGERRGYAALKALYPVPRLHLALRLPRSAVHVYARHGADEVNSGLLVDLITRAAAPGDPNWGELDRYLDGYLRWQRCAMLATARPMHVAELVTKLFWDRAAPGGRIATTYPPGQPIFLTDDLSIALDDLSSHVVFLNGTPVVAPWSTLLKDLVGRLDRRRMHWAALCHGDPTELNLGVPYVEYDHDTGGWNALAGVWAVFLAGVLRLGGAAVPLMAPGAFMHRPHVLAKVQDNLPAVQVSASHGTVHIVVRRRCAPARVHVARRYLSEVVQPVASAIGWSLAEVSEELRIFLGMRAAGVFDLRALPQELRIDTVVHLAQLLSGSPLWNCLGIEGGSGIAAWDWQ